MKTILSTLISIISINSFSDITVRPECYKNSNESIMYMDMFPWDQTPEQMKTNFETLYNSGKRMKNRVFFDGENYLMPFETFSYGLKNAVVPKKFIRSLIAQIESALESDYVEYISFSDMGHNHLFIPLDFYNGELSKFDTSNKHKRYEAMMNHSNLLMLYHTAEQLKFFNKRGDKLPLQDRYIQKRFYTRNIVGQNNGGKELKILFNLEASGQGVSDYKSDKYRYWGAGFAFNSTKKGCFSYTKNGKEFYFDISAEDVGYDPSSYSDYYEYLKQGTIK